jgi:hypothetical protein
MLALSQAMTERLLARALKETGGVVERGVRMVECHNVIRGVEAVLEAVSDARREVVRISVVDEAGKERTEYPVWRIMPNRPEPLSQLAQAEQVGPPGRGSTDSCACSCC